MVRQNILNNLKYSKRLVVILFLGAISFTNFVPKCSAQILGQVRDSSAVEHLIIVLKDKDWQVRENAAQKLGELKDPRAVGPLLTALADENIDVRRAAIKSLKEIKDPRAIEPLSIGLKSQSIFIRANAVTALGGINDPKAVELVTTALKDVNSGIRRIAGNILTSIEDPHLVEPVINGVDDNSEFAKSIAITLERITKMDFGSRFEAWRKWWKIAKNVGTLNTYTNLSLKKSFQNPYINGKMLIIGISKKLDIVEPVGIDSICIAFPEELLATRPEEVGTIVWLDWEGKQKVGFYIGSSGGNGYARLCEVTIIDKSISAIIWQGNFIGSNPPSTIKGFWFGDAYGNRPVSKVIDFLNMVPVRSSH